MPPIFNDLYKPLKDLLTKNYNGNSHKIEWKVKESCGTFNPTLEFKEGPVLGGISYEGEGDPCKWVHLKLKYAVNTRGVVKITGTGENIADIKGLKFEEIAELDMNQAGKDCWESKLELKKKNAIFNFQHSCGKACDFSAVGSHEGANVGVALVYEKCGLVPKAYKFAGTIPFSKDTTFFGQLDCLKLLKLGFTSRKNECLYGAEYSCSNIMAPNESTVTLGCEKKIDSKHTVKARIDSKMTFGASLSHALSDQLKFICSFEGDCKSYKFGTQLVLEH